MALPGISTASRCLLALPRFPGKINLRFIGKALYRDLVSGTYTDPENDEMANILARDECDSKCSCEANLCTSWRLQWMRCYSMLDLKCRGRLCGVR